MWSMFLKEFRLYGVDDFFHVKSYQVWCNVFVLVVLKIDYLSHEKPLKSKVYVEIRGLEL